MKYTTRLHGRAAIAHAEATGRTLSKHGDPDEGWREGLSVEEALEVVLDDPGLIYLDTVQPEKLGLYETNDGTLYLVAESEGIAVMMHRSGDFLTDCRTYRDSWTPEDEPEDLYGLDAVNPTLLDQQTTHCAVYHVEGDRLEILDEHLHGHAAREYLGSSLGFEPQYHVWVHIEEEHAEEEHRENDLPEKLATFATEQEAIDFAAMLGGIEDHRAEARRLLGASEETGSLDTGAVVELLHKIAR